MVRPGRVTAVRLLRLLWVTAALFAYEARNILQEARRRC